MGSEKWRIQLIELIRVIHPYDVLRRFSEASTPAKVMTAGWCICATTERYISGDGATSYADAEITAMAALLALRVNAASSLDLLLRKPPKKRLHESTIQSCLRDFYTKENNGGGREQPQKCAFTLKIFSIMKKKYSSILSIVAMSIK